MFPSSCSQQLSPSRWRLTSVRNVWVPNSQTSILNVLAHLYKQ